jgi:hypothetical protein
MLVEASLQNEGRNPKSNCTNAPGWMAGSRPAMVIEVSPGRSPKLAAFAAQSGPLDRFAR